MTSIDMKVNLRISLHTAVIFFNFYDNMIMKQTMRIFQYSNPWLRRWKYPVENIS